MKTMPGGPPTAEVQYYSMYTWVRAVKMYPVLSLVRAIIRTLNANVRVQSLGRFVHSLKVVRMYHNRLIATYICKNELVTHSMKMGHFLIAS